MKCRVTQKEYYDVYYMYNALSMQYLWCALYANNTALYIASQNIASQNIAAQQVHHIALKQIEWKISQQSLSSKKTLQYRQSHQGSIDAEKKLLAMRISRCHFISL